MIGNTARIITAKSNSMVSFPSKIKCFNWTEDSNVNNMISYSASSRNRLNLSLGALVLTWKKKRLLIRNAFVLTCLTLRTERST